LDEEQHQQAAGEVRNSRQVSGQRQTQCAYVDTVLLSRCCWVRKTKHRATEQSEKSHVTRLSINHQFCGLFTRISFLSATRKGALNSWWLKLTACTRYFRYAVWETMTW